MEAVGDTGATVDQVFVDWIEIDYYDTYVAESDELLFSASDITSLNNTNELTMVTVADCLNGFFTSPNPQVSVAEEFQRGRDKGAVVVRAPTVLSYTSGRQILIGEFCDTVFQDREYGLGAATTAAKIATYAQNSFWGELVETFVLFGDPATQSGVSANSPLPVITPNGGETIAGGFTYTIQWMAPQDIVKFTLKYSLIVTLRYYA